METPFRGLRKKQPLSFFSKFVVRPHPPPRINIARRHGQWACKNGCFFRSIRTLAFGRAILNLGEWAPPCFMTPTAPAAVFFADPGLAVRRDALIGAVNYCRMGAAMLHHTQRPCP